MRWGLLQLYIYENFESGHFGANEETTMPPEAEEMGEFRKVKPPIAAHSKSESKSKSHL